MSPELITAVRERVDKNFSKESIYEEMRAAGYDDDMIGSVYNKVTSESDSEVSPIPEVNSEVVNSVVPLPPFWSLFKESFFYTVKRKDLIGWNLLLTTSFLVMLFLTTWSFSVNVWFGFIFMIFAFIAIIFISINFGLAVYYIIANDNLGNLLSFKEGWNWARKNLFWSGLWILALFSLINQGAIILWFIPLIIIGPWLSFMIYAYTNEGFKGFSALFRARELGKGNWKGLLIRKLLFWFTILIPVIFILGTLAFSFFRKMIFISGDSLISFNHSLFFDKMFELLLIIILLYFVLFVYIMFIYVLNNRFNVLLFRELSTARPVNEESGKGTDKWKYIILIIAGLLLAGSSTEEPYADDWKDDLHEDYIDVETKVRAVEMRDEESFQEINTETEDIDINMADFTEKIPE